MCSVALLISSPKYLLFLCPADSNPKEKREDVSQKGEAKENISPSARIQEKRDLCMFLALHMENSPYCGKPKSESPAIGQFSKTGIVICEGLKFERIVAMDCSTENLHAVQKALLRLPDEQKGRQVFLSRIPCISCVKFLVQAQVSKIYFWPNFETEIKKISEEEREELQHRSILINNILKESCVYDAMFIPILNLEKAKIIASKANTNNISNNEISSVFDNSESDIKFALKLLNMSFLWEKEQLKNEVENAKKSFQILTGPEDKEYNFQINDVDKCKIQHASQLCNLLAARSDTYNKGEGTVIYKENSIVSVGYSGFPKGTMYDLFKKKNDGSLNHRIVVCAEANALILGLCMASFNFAPSWVCPGPVDAPES
ncbi:cytidine and dCMP deaminase domain-containing protein 1-like isoform X2 [Rhineura floridana]|uniref:cytidine and dCMP deaminase domain-containing protein 1-like isoform X2 n=1 Tax=Rhineura floridana TaxID=261503 RepID=UPI002AC86AA8|nr:cytidine and dCMP deaminase domain-containing protein 1-like isoform X2 [Rhineura floridana]